MKKLFTIIPVALLLLPSMLLATSDGPDYWKVVNVASDDVLNVRKEASWKSAKVIGIPYNATCLKNLGCTGGLTFQESINLPEAEKKKIRKSRPRWCKIRYKNVTGWVSARYLTVGQEAECYKKQTK